jgi:hypothetical protein
MDIYNQKIKQGLGIEAHLQIIENKKGISFCFETYGYAHYQGVSIDIPKEHLKELSDALLKALEESE